MKDIDVLNRLILSSDVTDIIDDKIWTTWLPEKTVLPAITCNYSNDDPVVTLNNDTLQGREVITINCWASDKQTAVDLITAVKAQMNGFAVRKAMVDLNEEEQGLYRYAIDYSIFS